MSKVNKDIYKMGLHDFIWLEDKGYSIIRVPGGWIYTTVLSEVPATSVFVPYDNGFMAVSPEIKEGPF